MYMRNKRVCMFLYANNSPVPNVGANLTIAELLFDYCNCCERNQALKMPGAVPQSAFAVCKMREREMKIAKLQKIESEPEKIFYDNTFMELSPLKYNSKLMNSIWGLYNRYSVHNFKKITDAGDDATAYANSQQCSGYSASVEKQSPGNKSTKNAPVLVSEWINLWGAHKY